MGFLNFGLLSRSEKKVKKTSAEKCHFCARGKKWSKKVDKKDVWKNRPIWTGIEVGWAYPKRSFWGVALEGLQENVDFAYKVSKKSFQVFDRSWELFEKGSFLKPRHFFEVDHW